VVHVRIDGGGGGIPAGVGSPLKSKRLQHDVIVIGASTGGVHALCDLFAQLGSLDAIVGVVLHRRPNSGRLSTLLHYFGGDRVREPLDGETLTPGRVYLAPAGCHMRFEAPHIALARSEDGNGRAPAIDPLFTSAARSLGRRVVGVLLSGTGSDGIAGLRAIKDAGGVTIVQDPSEALAADTPSRALRFASVDATLGLASLPRALAALASGDGAQGAWKQS